MLLFHVYILGCRSKFPVFSSTTHKPKVLLRAVQEGLYWYNKAVQRQRARRVRSVSAGGLQVDYSLSVLERGSCWRHIGDPVALWSKIRWNFNNPQGEIGSLQWHKHWCKDIQSCFTGDNTGKEEIYTCQVGKVGRKKKSDLALIAFMSRVKWALKNYTIP